MPFSYTVCVNFKMKLAAVRLNWYSRDVSLRKKLQEILPDILPASPMQAIKGTELIARIRGILGDSYSDRSYRSQFSLMMLDPDSCLARVENGQGYYLRREDGEEASPHSLYDLFEDDVRKEDNSLQRLLLALGARIQGADGKGVFVFPEDDTESWERPNLVSVAWPEGYWCDGAYCFRDSAGEGAVPSFRSVCVAPLSDAEENRRAFFRALATSLWGNEAELMLLGEGLLPEDEDELSQMAALYGVGVTLIELSGKQIRLLLPEAGTLFRANDAMWRETERSISIRRIASPRFRKEGIPSFEGECAAVVRSWTEGCLSRGRVEPYELRVSVS